MVKEEEGEAEKRVQNTYFCEYNLYSFIFVFVVLFNLRLNSDASCQKLK